MVFNAIETIKKSMTAGTGCSALKYRTPSLLYTKPKIMIINPEPDELVQKFIYEYGIDKELIRIERTYFDEHFDFESVINM